MAIAKVTVPKKKLEAIWAQVPPNYYDQGIENNPFQKLWHTTKLNKVLALLPMNIKTVLDVGCSSAILTSQIKKALPKAKITGVDSYRGAIEFAKTKYKNLNLIVADAHKLPFRDKSFDLVICTETLEHVTDPKKCLTEIKRVLKKNGKAIISMDSGNFLFTTIWFFWTKTTGKVWEGAHLHEFNAKVLEDLIGEAGFKIKKKVYSHLGMAVTFLALPKN